MHCPFVQTCPAPHAGPAPQTHEPLLQPSASVELHALHAPPPVPHVVTDCGVHVLPLQQPFGHDVTSHVHRPAMQCCPAVHCAFAPHLHVPPLHVSARTESHATHVPPPEPHVPIDGVLHVLPVQQPVRQVCAQPEHVPFEHVCPPPQPTQAAPAVPHVVGDCAVQTLPAQQPFGHDAALHAHWPPTHC
jgi:hypothetical protein